MKNHLTFIFKNGMTIMKKVVPGNTNLKEYQSFKDMVDYLNQERPSKDWVPTTTLFYFVDGNIVGAVDVRHELNHRLNIGVILGMA